MPRQGAGLGCCQGCKASALTSQGVSVPRGFPDHPGRRRTNGGSCKGTHASPGPLRPCLRHGDELPHPQRPPRYPLLSPGQSPHAFPASQHLPALPCPITPSWSWGVPVPIAVPIPVPCGCGLGGGRAPGGSHPVAGDCWSTQPLHRLSCPGFLAVSVTDHSTGTKHLAWHTQGHDGMARGHVHVPLGERTRPFQVHPGAQGPAWLAAGGSVLALPGTPELTATTLSPGRAAGAGGFAGLGDCWH